MNVVILILSLMISVISISCSSSDQSDVRDSTISCSELGLGSVSRNAFTVPIASNDKIETSLIYGGMYPEGDEDTPNLKWASD